MSRGRISTWTPRVVATGLGVCGLVAIVSAQAPRRTATVPWAGRGVWLTADFHTHTKFTDGVHTIDEVVAAASKHACDVVAITDHGDGDLKGATQEWFDAVRAARAAHSGLAVMMAMEWNVPPGKGNEHATVLFPSHMEALTTLAGFKDRFDDQIKKGENPELAFQGLAALKPAVASAIAPVMFFNHPSRRPASTSAPKLTFETLRKAAPAVLIGFEGAPGHQRATPLGAYTRGVTPIDRWDPMAAEPGGAWDEWLGKGLDVWAAIANSDFHHARDDFWPCEFAATRVYAPDRTVDGVIRALRAGSFFAEHGHIVSDVELHVRVAGAARAAIAGETIVAKPGTVATVSLQMKVPPTDYLGRENRVDTVELIGISLAKADVLFSGPPGRPDAFTTTVTVPEGGIVLRARGRRVIEGEPGLMFYTNPIRVTTPAR